MGEKISLSHDLATFNLQTQFINCFSYGIRSAVKNFGIERFKTNCHRATDGFNLVMAHLHTRQQYLKDMQMKKFQQIRQTGETVIARYGQQSNMFLLCINMTRHKEFGKGGVVGCVFCVELLDWVNLRSLGWCWVWFLGLWRLCTFMFKF